MAQRRRCNTGGWLGGALAWHLSAMWILFIDGGAYESGVKA